MILLLNVVFCYISSVKNILYKDSEVFCRFRHFLKNLKTGEVSAAASCTLNSQNQIEPQSSVAEITRSINSFYSIKSQSTP